jgi:hypothetical protein
MSGFEETLGRCTVGAHTSRATTAAQEACLSCAPFLVRPLQVLVERSRVRARLQRRLKLSEIALGHLNISQPCPPNSVHARPTTARDRTRKSFTNDGMRQWYRSVL